MDGRLRVALGPGFRASYSGLAYATGSCGHGKAPMGVHTVTSS